MILVEEDVKREEEEEFQECRELEVEVPEGAPVISMDSQVESEEEIAEVKMIQQMDCEPGKARITLDSGADVSVLPRSFSGHGRWSPGKKGLNMIDAQGREIKHAGMTRLKMQADSEGGRKVDFVLGDVKHPILCAGKMLRQGLSIRNEEDGLFLVHQIGTRLPLKMERHSLLFDAYVSTVEVKEAEDGSEVKEEDEEGRALGLDEISQQVREGSGDGVRMAEVAKLDLSIVWASGHDFGRCATEHWRRFEG